MIIDTAAKAKTFRIISSLVSLVYLLSFTTILIMLYPGWTLPWGRDILLVIITVIYVIVIAKRFILSPYYIYVNNEGAVLHFKYFTLHPFLIQKYAIEIPKSEFAGYELKRSCYGLCNNILLKRVHKGKKINYPLIRLSILTKEERQQLFEILEKDTNKSLF